MKILHSPGLTAYDFTHLRTACGRDLETTEATVTSRTMFKVMLEDNDPHACKRCLAAVKKALAEYKPGAHEKCSWAYWHASHEVA